MLKSIRTARKLVVTACPNLKPADIDTIALALAIARKAR